MSAVVKLFPDAPLPEFVDTQREGLDDAANNTSTVVRSVIPKTAQAARNAIHHNGTDLNINPFGVWKASRVSTEAMARLSYSLSNPRAREAYASLPSVKDGTAKVTGFRFSEGAAAYLSIGELATPMNGVRYAGYVSLPLRLYDPATRQERIILAHTDVAAVRVDPYTGVATFEPAASSLATEFVFDWTPAEFKLLTEELARMSEGLFPSVEDPYLDIPVHVFEGIHASGAGHATA